MKPKIIIIKIKRGLWYIEMWIGSQGFTFDYKGTKEECKWYKKMLLKALGNL